MPSSLISSCGLGHGGWATDRGSTSRAKSHGYKQQPWPDPPLPARDGSSSRAGGARAPYRWKSNGIPKPPYVFEEEEQGGEGLKEEDKGEKTSEFIPRSEPCYRLGRAPTCRGVPHSANLLCLLFCGSARGAPLLLVLLRLAWQQQPLALALASCRSLCRSITRPPRSRVGVVAGSVTRCGSYVVHMDLPASHLTADRRACSSHGPDNVGVSERGRGESNMWDHL